MLVGRSHECDFPVSIADRPVLTSQKTHAATSAEIDRQVREALAEGSGGTSLYRLDVDLLRELRPDLILTQDLCDVCSIDLNAVRAAAAGMPAKPAVVSLNPASIEDVFDDMLRVGHAICMAAQATDATARLRDRYWSARDRVNPYVDGPEVAFLEWMAPLFVGGHWTPQLIQMAGGRHSLNEPGKKSRQVSPEELVASRPERVIICPCGFDLERIERELPSLVSKPWWRELPAVQAGRVVMVDGNQMFNRPGPRLVDAYEWLTGWINDLDQGRAIGRLPEDAKAAGLRFPARPAPSPRAGIPRCRTPVNPAPG